MTMLTMMILSASDMACCSRDGVGGVYSVSLVVILFFGGGGSGVIIIVVVLVVVVDVNDW